MHMSRKTIVKIAVVYFVLLGLCVVAYTEITTDNRIDSLGRDIESQQRQRSQEDYQRQFERQFWEGW